MEKWEWYAAQIPLVFAQVHGNKKMKLKDFCIQHGEPKKVKPSVLFEALAALGGKVKRFVNGNN